MPAKESEDSTGEILRELPAPLPKMSSTNTTALPEAGDEELFFSPYEGHTKHDQRDMDRMGKRQTFIVCILPFLCFIC